MTTPEARYQRWRQSALVVWATIGGLMLLAAAMWGLGKIAGALVPFVIAFILVFLLNWPVARPLTSAACREAPLLALCLVAAFAGARRSHHADGSVRRADRSSRSPNPRPSYLHQLEQARHRAAGALREHRVPAVARRVRDRCERASVAVRGRLSATRLRRAWSYAGGGVATGFLDFVLAIVIAFWALKDLPKLRDEVIALAGPKYEDDAEHLFATVTRVVGGYLKGQTIASLAHGAARDDRPVRSSACPYALVLGIMTVHLQLRALRRPVHRGPHRGARRAVRRPVDRGPRHRRHRRRAERHRLLRHPAGHVRAGRPASDPRDILAARRRHALRDSGHALRHPGCGHRQGPVRLLLRAAHRSGSLPARTARCSGAPGAIPTTRRSRRTKTIPGCPEWRPAEDH